MTSEADDPRKPPAVDKARLLELLACGEIEDTNGTLRWSSNYTFLVAVTDHQYQIQAVYKPQRGERPLWDFPEGTLCYRERAAFVISDSLGWDLVPPTVLRNGSKGLGSVQVFVPHDPDVNYFTLDERYVPQLMRMVAFDCLINNADRKGGHCLVDPNDHLWGIDHGIGFNHAPKMRTVIWDFAGQKIPEPILTDLQQLIARLETSDHSVRIELDKLLAQVEVAALIMRGRRLLQRREFPRPGPGPNYPWPPV